MLSPCRLAVEPRQRSDKAPVELRVSVSRRIKNSTSGEMEWQSSFFNIIVWGEDRTAVLKLEKGTTLHIVGRLDTNEWTDRHEQKRSDVRIVADSVSITLPEPPNEAGKENQEPEESWQF